MNQWLLAVNNVANRRREVSPTREDLGDYEKTCNQCGETKHWTEFHYHATTKDRLQTACIDCRVEGMRKWRAKRKEATRGTNV